MHLLRGALLCKRMEGLRELTVSNSIKLERKATLRALRNAINYVTKVHPSREGTGHRVHHKNE